MISTEMTKIYKQEHRRIIKSINDNLRTTNIPIVLFKIIDEYVLSEEEVCVRFKLTIELETIPMLFKTNNELVIQFMTQRKERGNKAKKNLNENRTSTARLIAVRNQNEDNTAAIQNHVSKMNSLFAEYSAFGSPEKSIVKRVKEITNEDSSEDDEKSNPDLDVKQDI